MRHENTPDLWDTAPAEYFTEGGGPILYGTTAPPRKLETIRLADVPLDHPGRRSAESEIAMDGWAMIQYKGRPVYVK